MLTEFAKTMYVAKSKNNKTGDVPQQFIGHTREESRKSCGDCPLLSGIVEDGKTVKCYAHSGTVAMGHTAAIKSMVKNPERYTLSSALRNRAKSARIFRFGAIGDPQGVNPEELKADLATVESEGLTVVGYTHHWRKSHTQYLKGYFRASCNTLAEADEAISKGWRATAIIPHWNPEADPKTLTTAQGHRGTVCPWFYSGSKCNDCGLCSAKGTKLVIFPAH